MYRHAWECSMKSIYIYITTYMKRSIIGTGRLIILLIIISFHIDLAATFAL